MVTKAVSRTVRFNPIPGARSGACERRVFQSGFVNIPKPVVPTKPLGYTMTVESVFDYSARGSRDSSWCDAALPWTNETSLTWTISTAKGRMPLVYELARKRMYDKLRGDNWNQKAEWLTSLVEANKTHRMINARVQQLNELNDLQSAVNQAREESRRKAVKRLVGTLRRNARGHPKLPSVGRTAALVNKIIHEGKGLGKLWLEYWMGWAPLVGDIWTGLQRLGTQEAEVFRVSGSCRIPLPEETMTKLSGSYPWYRYTRGGVYQVRVRGAVRRLEMNQLILHDLGLTNPWLTIHDILPWSWLLAWGHNLRSVLAQWDDDYGITWENQSKCVSYLVRHSMYQWTKGTSSSKEYVAERGKTVVHFTREVGSFPALTLRFRPVDAKISRAATVLSLFFNRLGYISRH